MTDEYDGYYCNECRQEGKGNCECPKRCFDCDEVLSDEVLYSDRFIYDEVCYDCLSKRRVDAMLAEPKPGMATRIAIQQLLTLAEDAVRNNAIRSAAWFDLDELKAILAENKGAK